MVSGHLTGTLGTKRFSCLTICAPPPCEIISTRQVKNAGNMPSVLSISGIDSNPVPAHGT